MPSFTFSKCIQSFPGHFWPSGLMFDIHAQDPPDPILFFTVMKLIKCNCVLTNTNY